LDGVDVTGTVTNQALADTTFALRIGSDGAGGFWNGGLDEVAIYKTALTPAQVLTHYQIGLNDRELDPLSAWWPDRNHQHGHRQLVRR
jgi:Concanavalin A-like lectin/glucanases superfamily